MPSQQDRQEMITYFIPSAMRFASDVTAEVVARSTPGYSAADLKLLMNEAVFQANFGENPQVSGAHVFE